MRRASVDCTGRKGMSADLEYTACRRHCSLLIYSRTDFGTSGSMAASVNLHDYAPPEKRCQGHAL